MLHAYVDSHLTSTEKSKYNKVSLNNAKLCVKKKIRINLKCIVNTYRIAILFCMQNKLLHQQHIL